MQRGFNLGQGTAIRFRGKDRCRVFNNLCTQDLRALADGQSLETFITDVKGRTFGHGIAIGTGDEALFVTVPDQAGKLVPHFDRYIIREDAVLDDVSGDYQFWLFQNRSSAAVAFSIPNEDTPSASTSRWIEWDGQNVLLLHAGWIGPDSVIGLVPVDCSDQVMIERLGNQWFRSDMLERKEWELARIQAFWPWYGIDMDDRQLPQELDRDSLAISFNKGCYLGQETIARLDMLGKVQKKLVKIVVHSRDCPTPQTAIQADGKEVGTVCSAAFDSMNETSFVLGFVKRSHFAPGQILTIQGHEGIVSDYDSI